VLKDGRIVEDSKPGVTSPQGGEPLGGAWPVAR
jgi:hypothetical protein